MDPERVPNVADALGRYEWHGNAACRDTDDPDAWFTSEHGAESDPRASDRRALMAMETCGRCRVRTHCLTDGLATWVVEFPNGNGRGAQRVTVRATGLWGGTFTSDRRRVRGLPIDEAVQVLEGTLEERLRRRRQAGEGAPGAAAG